MKNQILRLQCIDMTVDFYGVCKNDGLVIFVKGLIIDEIADVKVIKETKNLSYGIIEKLIVKSKYRIKEPCPVAYKCGGCDIQHIDYNYQLVLKKNLIEKTFINAKLNVKVLDVIHSDQNLNYRNKIQVPVKGSLIGYYRNHSNDIVEFDDCYISSVVGNIVLLSIKKIINKYDINDYIRHIVIRNSSKDIMVCFVVNNYDIPNIYDVVNDIISIHSDIKSIIFNLNNVDTNVIYGKENKVLYGEPYITDKIDEYKYMIPLTSFYQVNYHQMVNLYRLIIDNGSLNINDSVLDLFCGIGTISIYISKYVKKVLGIEIVKKSIEYANKNKQLNNIDNIEFILADANIIDKYVNDYNVVIVDPPRKGISSKLIDTLNMSSFNKIIYISCNQATLARDLKRLSSKYLIAYTQPIDMFPQTKHIESITILTKKNLL